MPIIRTYQCAECNHRMEVVLDSSQWDDEPPECPECQRRQMHQEFKPIAIGGSHSARAHALAEQIVSEDYHVADFQPQSREGHAPKVRYKDDSGQVQKGAWTGPGAKQLQLGREALESAIAIGKQTRLKHGSGLDVLRAGLNSGDIPDLIENSKRKSPRIW